MIEPDFFGCSGKLPYDETRHLADSGRPGSPGDFSQLVGEGVMISSIDRVHRCAKDWSSFARIALNHAFGDVICAGARPVQAMLSFEFGLDAPEVEHAKCSAAFARELTTRGVALGKCHSGRTVGVTAVTIATLGTRPQRLQSDLSQGVIYLSRPIGALKLLYLSEMGIEVDACDALRSMEWPRDDAFHAVPWELVTDVSGHGLLGAAAQIAERENVRIDLDLSPRHACSADVLSVPVLCLQNPLFSYGLSLEPLVDAAETLLTLRETAGPFLGFAEDGSDAANAAKGIGVPLGHYRRGPGGIAVTWSG